ncbi:MAG: hypothetical protein RBG13Loki_1618 [Promethearchaeota archaeon CR_4]|nr:MAG: hypothetical protein RBG13Loki_1618 [Candidatus Lokiarchaeota archaeon CR_4]
MTTILEFRKEAVLEVERDFSKLQLPPDTKQGIAGAAQIYAKFLPMSELAIKGFIAMSMRDFQVQEKVDATTLNKLPKEQRERYVKIIERILQDKLEKVLLRPEQRTVLQEAVKKAFEYSTKIAAEASKKTS